MTKEKGFVVKKLISYDWVVSERAQIQFLCHNPKHVDFTQEERYCIGYLFCLTHTKKYLWERILYIKFKMGQTLSRFRSAREEKARRKR